MLRPRTATRSRSPRQSPRGVPGEAVPAATLQASPLCPEGSTLCTPRGCPAVTAAGPGTLTTLPPPCSTRPRTDLLPGLRQFPMALRIRRRAVPETCQAGHAPQPDPQSPLPSPWPPFSSPHPPRGTLSAGFALPLDCSLQKGSSGVAFPDHPISLLPKLPHCHLTVVTVDHSKTPSGHLIPNTVPNPTLFSPVHTVMTFTFSLTGSTHAFLWHI